VSAVGHEIDFTIADFVADLRAPTPSAAAELVAPDTSQLLRQLRSHGATLNRHVEDALEQWKSRLDFAGRGALFREPANFIAGAWQSVDLAEKALRFSAQSQLSESAARLRHAFAKLREHRPDQQLEIKRRSLAMLAACIEQHTANRMQSLRHSVE